MSEFNENSQTNQGITEEYMMLHREDGIYLVVNPSDSIDKRALMTKIIERILRKGIKNPDRQAMQTAVEAANGQPVKIAAPQDEEKLDAVLNVNIAQDKMSANLVLMPPEGEGKELTLAEMQKTIQAKGVVYGIDMSILEELAAKPRYLETIEFAKGELAKRGDDGQVELLFDMDTQKKPTILEDGSVDFHEIRKIAMAKKGDELARVHPPKQGTPGKTIMGQIIPPANGKPAQIPRGKNTDLVNKDAYFSIIATIEGQISYIDYKINVLNVYEVQGNVGVETGNVHFVGNVVVKGNVTTDFIIEATGNVEVYGVVEGATIKAGGDIIVKRGIQGLHKAILISEHDIIAKYIEHSTVTARNDIKCEAIMHSNINCGNIVELGGKKGLIVGGSIKAGKQVNAKIVGSPMSTVTDIEVGVDPTIRDRYKEVKNHINELEAELKKTDQAVDILKKLHAAGQLSPEKQEMLNKLLRTKVNINTQLPELQREVEQMDERMSQVHFGKLKVSDTIYPGCKITIGTISKFIKENQQFVTFHLDGADIKATPYER